MISINPEDAGLYVSMGIAFYYKRDYCKAIRNYTCAIKINPDLTHAYYNRGLALFATQNYSKSIEDYSRVINRKEGYKDVYYLDRGNAWFAQKKFKDAIDDYTNAIQINSDLENAYYIRGIAKKEEGSDLASSKQDFEKYLELAIDKNEIWTKYAIDYIKELDAMIKDPALRTIKQLVNDIKKLLLIEEECVHYTSISTLQKLVLEESKFRIFEGNFMNDPSEGKVFYDFMQYKLAASCKDNPCAETYSPKPFIGSFVTEAMHNDLDMWRFYGKEKGIEAKGCAITINSQKFIEVINSILTEEEKDARQVNESDIHFYRVAYYSEKPKTKFCIPSSEENELELLELMKNLKNNVEKYKGINKTFLEKYLNCIAFLFKSDAYKNENEVRLVVKGIEFKKDFDFDSTPPKVFIELESIKKLVKQITLGPKVDNVNEWASAFHYHFEEETPDIVISHLPYK
jgi:tetratricopeptide (TPR) repeat protein